MRKWLTNDAALRKHINENENASVTEKVTRLDDFQTYVQASLDIPLDNSCDKVLGLIWDCEDDLIKFDLLKLVESLKGTNLTKRNLLSTLAKMFDPLGLVIWAIFKTGNGELGNGERGMGNGERGMRNGERGMRNGERGMGNGE